jgi:hypothetical protein
LAALVAVATPAAATFHEISVVEVHGGSPAAPDAQYVVLRTFSAGQRFLAGHPMQYWDAGGSFLDAFAFTDDVANGAEQARILIATSTAERLFGVVADLRVPAVMEVEGGKLCFDVVDCFSWGSYPGDDAGTPYQTGTGLGDGLAAKRRLDVCQDAGCSDGELDAADDTGDSADDFVTGTPAPRNNAGATGAADPDAVFLHGFEDGRTSVWSARLL